MSVIGAGLGPEVMARRRELQDLVDGGLASDLDVLGAFFGKRLGAGVSRMVYLYKLNPERVIKLAVVEPGYVDFQNQAEWDLWQATGDKLAEWLAPCLYISPRGTLLVQEYCEPCPKHLIPDRVPRIIADAHDANWGIYKGRPVLHDYGRSYAYKMANNVRAMKLVCRFDHPEENDG